MLQYFDTLTNVSGAALYGATLQVLNAAGSETSPIYLTDSTSEPIANSTVSADVTGQVSFFIPDGLYTFKYSYNASVYKTRSPVMIGISLIEQTTAENAQSVTPTSLDYIQGNALRYGADPTGTADSGTAFDAMVPALGVGQIPFGTYKTASTPTGALSVIVYGATFTGANPLNAWTPAFGTPDLMVLEKQGNDAFIGAVQQSTAFTGSNGSFPTGVTGYGQLTSAATGNDVYGVFAQADLYAEGNAIAFEADSFNYAANAGNNLPPNLAFGTTDYNAIAALLAAYGDYSSQIGLLFAYGSQRFETGMYFHPKACATYGIVVDASANTTTTLQELIKHKTGSQAVQWQGVGTPSSSNNVALYVDGNGTTQWGLQENGTMYFSYRSTGWGTPTGGSVQNDFAGGSATLAQTSAALAKIISTLQFLGLLTT